MGLRRAMGFSGSREWIYPQSIRGRFTKLRRWTFLGLHVILFLVPLIRVNGYPLLLIDIPHRRVHLFGAVFSAADTIFLVLLLLFAAFALFFFTAIFGRVWCGYACPQTVFLESWIRPIEMWIEGDRVQRKRRDARGVTFDRAWRKAAKWGVFLAVSLLLAMALVSVFAGAIPLWTGRASGTAYAFVAVFTALWYLDFTWFREQFCTYVCPYARFQSALTDDETLLVSYDIDRGEPRDRTRGPEGGCVNCRKCVVVCPQGIDIRDGFQLECIQCARCIDACESVMSRFDQPTLVRYSSIAADQGGERRTFRPRTLVYGGLLTTLVAAGLVLLMGRVHFEATVNRAPGSLFQTDADGYVRNTYLLKVTDKHTSPGRVRYDIALEGLEGAEVIAAPFSLAGSETRTIPLIVRMLESRVDRRTVPFRVRISTLDDDLMIGTTFKTGARIGGESQ